jgi:hypothetical protein
LSTKEAARWRSNLIKISRDILEFPTCRLKVYEKGVFDESLDRKWTRGGLQQCETVNLYSVGLDVIIAVCYAVIIRSYCVISVNRFVM